MGCDGYADKNGELEIEISLYGEDTILVINFFKGLEPDQKISVNWTKGVER